MGGSFAMNDGMVDGSVRMSVNSLRLYCVTFVTYRIALSHAASRRVDLRMSRIENAKSAVSIRDMCKVRG